MSDWDDFKRQPRWYRVTAIVGISVAIAFMLWFDIATKGQCC